ncbi:LacI family DNA-binding transcriptional regulator [Pseudonocardia sp. TRM90224]|uniref:LacI family DNA-binding transcriptional regulator n=1 Tax=Pseudonocardia sp. TRM90224 TaxID=2812678 RepID=UPI001E5A7841|nr:LacI family DNA-binding transcriptional regulator [Pseudonocardia sp. TRM90224]
MPVTLRDVADHAGVSVKTVSNVVNGFRHVSPDTRARVQEALDRLGYQVNLSARSLRAGRTGIIALAVPELRQSSYFSELAGAVMQHAEERGLVVLIEQTLQSRQRELDVLSGARNRLVDGVIFSPLELGPDDLATAPAGLPIVLLGERVAAGGPLDHVSIDNVAAAREAVTHLLRIGRRRIAAIGLHPDERIGTAEQRFRGYAEALTGAGLPLRRELLGDTGPWHRENGAACMRALLARDPRPDAVFCFNDMLAVGALRELLRSGVRVPEDVALVGFDDVEEARFSTPSLTTVAPDLDGVARAAVGLLQSRISGDRPPGAPHTVTRQHRLVVRESTVGLPRP